jgi:hypothetical protein
MFIASTPELTCHTTQKIRKRNEREENSPVRETSTRASPKQMVSRKIMKFS